MIGGNAMRKHGPVNVIMYIPKTEEGKLELAKRVAEVHANAVQQRIKSLACPNGQKLALLDAVIEDARKKAHQDVHTKASEKAKHPGIDR